MPWLRVALIGFGLSLGIETAQLFTPERYPSLFDLASNTTGALLGAYFAARLAPRVDGADALLLEHAVLNLAHPNDTVTRYPFAPDARTVGKVYRISQGTTGGLVHNLPSYAKYLRPDLAAGKLAPHWPLVESRSAAHSGGG